MKIKKFFLPSNRLFAEIKYFDLPYSDYVFHSHSSPCFCFIKKGLLKVRYLGNEEYIKKKNNIFIFNAKQVHKIENIDGEGYCVLFVDNDWLKTIQIELFGKATTLNHKLNFNQKINDIFVDICEKLLQKDDTNVEKILYEVIRKFYLFYAIKHFGSIKKDFFIEPINEYIYSNISHKISTSEIAKFLGYNKSYFIREFKKKIGITPNTYIINYKIEKAKSKILTNSIENNISFLSQELGFYDQSHLNRNFKKIYGVSPSKYL